MAKKRQNCISQLTDRLVEAQRVWLFLDYDGTLAGFAPTPDHIHPDLDLITLLGRLAHQPVLRLAVISGRRLDHIQQLVPVRGILLAGTYGVELQTPDGDLVERVPYDAIRPALDMLKAQWEDLLVGHEGFYLEDKGWALALHARLADDKESEDVLAAARRLAEKAIEGETQLQYRLLGGHKFLELGPLLAHKGRTVDYLLEQYSWPGAQLVYVGDDDKDEEAFTVIQDQGGVAVVVASESRPTEADYRLSSPQATREWLNMLAERLEEQESAELDS
jgi:trehalose 6-phosphate phosphatase